MLLQEKARATSSCKEPAKRKRRRRSQTVWTVEEEEEEERTTCTPCRHDVFMLVDDDDDEEQSLFRNVDVPMRVLQVVVLEVVLFIAIAKEVLYVCADCLSMARRLRHFFRRRID